MLLLSTLTYHLDSQINLGYQLPHHDILSLADASPAPLISINDDASEAILLKRSMYKSIDELSKEEVRLGGLRLDPDNFMSSRLRYMEGASILDILTEIQYEISGLPKLLKLVKMSWSPNQDKIAIVNVKKTGADLYVIDLLTKQAKLLIEDIVHGSLGKTYIWIDNEKLLVKLRIKDEEGIINRTKVIPSGPTISENDGQKAQNRTYQDLLKNPIDELNFERLTKSRLGVVNINGEQQEWQGEAIWDDIELSPDRKFVLTSQIRKPFSYIVPYYRFPVQLTIYDIKGNLLKDQFSIPLLEELTKGFMSVTTHPRRIGWRNDHPATLVWAEALDEGDPEKQVDYRDAVYQLSAPFTDEKKLLIKTKERYSGISWCNDSLAILYEYWWNTRNSRTSKFNPSIENAEPTLLIERNYQDHYTDPGAFVAEKNQFGKSVLSLEGESLFLLGDGYNDQGKHPFVDKFNIYTGEKKRLFQVNDDSKLEDFTGAIDIQKGLLLTRIESRNEYPNYYIRDIKNGTLTPITSFENPFKVLENVHKEVIAYKREDGTELSATLYLPVGYNKEKKEKMPMLMWAYPREFKDKSTAGQTTNNSNEFTFPYYGSPIYWVNRGYVVLDDAAFPIVGEGEKEPNDSFIDQLVSNAKAAIDAVDSLGYIDRNRIGVGGHSYGAFMTANLLSHSDLFAAGIARSGAYNRTLTPFGFQSEERSYWEAPEIYYQMSPFMHADRMKTPLLLIHGEADNNSGTYPMQSERYFHALKGLGATVRLVMLPKESHGYASRESIMHLLWEQDQWLEKYVKNKESSNP
jgi:dipeptidyl aminopeptidase/acylaminoacyl peptidase